MYTERMTEALPVVAAIDPQLADDTTVSSDLVDMENRRRVIFVLLVGATDTTVDAKIREAQDGSATGEQDLTGKSITQIAADEDNGQVIIEVAAEEMSTGYTHLSLDVTVGDGSTGAYIAAVALAGVTRYKPDTDDLSSVAEIVT
jgi:hypothetical protein